MLIFIYLCIISQFPSCIFEEMNLITMLLSRNLSLSRRWQRYTEYILNVILRTSEDKPALNGYKQMAAGYLSRLKSKIGKAKICMAYVASEYKSYSPMGIMCVHLRAEEQLTRIILQQSEFHFNLSFVDFYLIFDGPDCLTEYVAIQGTDGYIFCGRKIQWQMVWLKNKVK